MAESIIKDPSVAANNYVVFPLQCTSVSLSPGATNSDYNITASVAKTGYTPIAIVGIKTSGNHTQYSNGDPGVDVRSFIFGSSTITLRLHDFWVEDSSAANASATVYVLYKEN